MKCLFSVTVVFVLFILEFVFALDKSLQNVFKRTAFSSPTEIPVKNSLHVVGRTGHHSVTILSNFTTLQLPGINELLEEKDERIHSGIYIVIFHERSGKQLSKYHHIQPWAEPKTIQRFVDSVQPGRILLFLLKNDLQYGLSQGIRDLFRRLGSVTSDHIGRGMLWGWLWVKGGVTLSETVTFPTRRKVGSPALLMATVGLPGKADNKAVSCPYWPKSEHWKRRRKFCDRFEQYGDLCHCDNPHQLNFPETKIENSQIDKAVVVVLAHRVPSLYRSLKSVMSAQGFSRQRFEVFTQEPHEELAEFLRLVDLPLTVTHQTDEFLATIIGKQFAFIIDFVLQKYRDANLIIFLEEDVSVSPDFFIFLNRTARLLQDDPSLYCVSAHNDLSYPQTSHDPRAVLRTESYPNYGWMVTRSFAQEMAEGFERMSQGTQTEYDWDVYTYFYLRGDRECIIPEVSRSHHFGESGSHISQYMARILFLNKNYNQDPTALVEGVEKLEKDTYERYIDSLLSRAEAIDVEKDSPCDSGFFDKFTSDEEKVYILYVEVEGNIRLFRFNDAWTTLARCLGFFSSDVREGHTGLHRLRLGAAHLLIVAYPASPYSFPKPSNIPVFRATPSNKIQAMEIQNKGISHEEYLIEDVEMSYQRLIG